MGKEGIGSFLWYVCGAAAFLTGLAGLWDTWESQTNNYYVLAISQMSTKSVGMFHACCGVRGNRAAESTGEHRACAANHLTRLPAPALATWALSGHPSHVGWGTRPWVCVGFCRQKSEAIAPPQGDEKGKTSAVVTAKFAQIKSSCHQWDQKHGSNKTHHLLNL